MQIDRPITIAVTLFIILILIFFLVMPEYNRFKSLQQTLGEKIAEFNAEYDYYNAIDTTYYQIQSHMDGLQKIDDALPTDPNMGRLVYFLQKKGTDSGIIINSLFLSKSAGVTANSVKDVGFSLNLIGSYSSLEAFLRTLEKSSRIFEITGITFSSTTNAPISGAGAVNATQFQTQQIYSFNVELKTHTY
jgi:Tfp pilus assembly protein PilO